MADSSLKPEHFMLHVLTLRDSAQDGCIVGYDGRRWVPGAR